MNTPQASIIDQIADERDELRDENQKLRNYIKKLENEGDACMCRGRDGQKEWNKLKESKP